jgi:hypothetical protein
VSLGVHSAELVRRLNEDTVDWDWTSRRIGIMVTLNSRVLEARAGDEPRLSLTAEQHLAAAEHAKRMARYLRRSGAQVVGELTDLRSGPPPTSREVVDPADSTPDDLLDAARAGLVGMAREYADLTLRRKVIRRLEQEEGAAEDAPGWRDRLDLGALKRVAGRVPGARAIYGRLRGVS